MLRQQLLTSRATVWIILDSKAIGKALRPEKSHHFPHIEGPGFSLPASWLILHLSVNQDPVIPPFLRAVFERGEPARSRLLERDARTLPRSTIDSESVLRSLFENAHHFGIFRLQVEPSNPGTVSVVLASPSIRDMMGIEDLYDFSKWFEHIHTDDIERVKEANQRSLREGSSYNQTARLFNPKEGRWRWIQTISSPGYDARGRLSHFDGMMIDLTEQKEAELALQNLTATLEQRVRERTEEIERRRQTAESLRDILHMINSNMPLQEFLQKAVELAARQLGAGACVLHHLDLEREVISQLAGYGIEGIFEVRGERPFSALGPSGGADYLKGLLRKKPTFGNYGPLPDRIEAIRNDPNIPDPIKAERIALRTRFAASFAAPLYIQDQLYGGIVFYYTEPQEFKEDQIQLGLTFAGQFALAIENAMLREQAAEAAVLSERNRIARDLHDAVSQTLFSASLVAEVLPKLWERNPAAARQKLEELRQLTKGALSEMRTLLLELRPDALADMDLAELIKYLANACTGRTLIPVDMSVEGNWDPPPAVKEAAYRIAQEALNNVIKHSEASHVTVALDRDEHHVRLEVRDNGRGFDPSEAPAGHYGLGIMQERADMAEGALHLHSSPGEGTSVMFEWREKEK